MTRKELQQQKDAWSGMFTARASEATHGLTVCYNNVFGATASWCYRIAEYGECFLLPTSGVPVEPGVNRLPTIRRIPLERVHADLEKWHYYTDRDLYGPRFYKRAEYQRSSFIGMVEHEESNVHVHLLWTMPEAEANALADVAVRHWKRITGGYGTVAVARLFDANGWASYCCKDLGKAVLAGDPLLFVSSAPARAETLLP